MLPRYWVAEHHVESELVDEKRRKNWPRDWLLGWRDICRSSDVRTVIPSVLPRVGVGDKFLLALAPERAACLQANLTAIVLDFCARQKIVGTSLKYFLIKQLPVLPPTVYDIPCPWSPADQLAGWVTTRVLELAYTSHDLAGFARDHGDAGPPFRWDPKRRLALRAELDAAYFHLYGVARDDVDYVLDTFRAFRNNDPDRFNRTRKAVLEVYDEMAAAIASDTTYQGTLDPPAGHGPRHPAASS